MWEWAGLAFWFREELLQVENPEKIILAELEERKEWESWDSKCREADAQAPLL